MKTKDVSIIRIVRKEGLACTMKSGSLPVLATPQMIAWMEEAACACLELEEGMSSVGTFLSVCHDAPSPEGAEICIQARVLKIEGRKVAFHVSAYMNEICIGRGEHTRCIVNSERFLSKCGI